MSLSILKLLGHALASADLPPTDKKASWALFCLAFYGSLRMGELLCSRATAFDTVDSFLWSDVNWASSDHVILSFRNTRTAKHEQVDLFAIPGCSTCPVSALKAFQQLTMRQLNSPVFSWSTGLFITIKDVNNLLSSLLQPLLGSSAAHITAHSFRAAIPSLLASFPEAATSSDIMEWGRWSSSAFQSYTRLKSNQSRKIFNKILSFLHRRPGAADL